MGTSTDAILVYGIPFEDEEQLPEFMGDFDDWDEYIDDHLGIPAYGEPNRPDYKDREKLVAAVPVDLVMHCSYDYSMYILAVRGTKTKASRGYPHVFENGIPAVSDEAVAAFHEWAAAHGVEGEGRWILCSMWG